MPPLAADAPLFEMAGEPCHVGVSANNVGVSTDHVGAPADHVAQWLRESAADFRGGGGAGQALLRVGATLRAAGMRRGLCAFRG